MKISVEPSLLAGDVAVPGSKSHTIRGVAAGLMAGGVTTLEAPLASADTLSVLEAAKALGAEVEQGKNRWIICGTDGKLRNPGHIIDMGNSGTGLRIISALAATADFEVTFDGDESLRSRLMDGLLASLGNIGAECKSAQGFCPVSVKGPLAGGISTVDGTTSQFISALLFAAPYAGSDCEFSLPFLNEKPYVGITLKWLKMLGIELEHSDDLQYFKIKAGQRFRAGTHIIPADFSTAAFPLAAGLLCGDAGRGGVRIHNLDFSDVQGDKAVFGMAQEMCGAVLPSEGGIVSAEKMALSGRVLDLNATPDALPVMAVLGAKAAGKTLLTNAPQARVKETDRISCMHEELAKMGIEITEYPDGMEICGGTLHGSRELDSRGDHRIGMAMTVAALAADSPSVIENIECVSVTYPDFIADMQKMGAKISVL